MQRQFFSKEFDMKAKITLAYLCTYILPSPIFPRPFVLLFLFVFSLSSSLFSRLACRQPMVDFRRFYVSAAKPVDQLEAPRKRASLA